MLDLSLLSIFLSLLSAVFKLMTMLSDVIKAAMDAVYPHIVPIGTIVLIVVSFYTLIVRMQEKRKRKKVNVVLVDVPSMYYVKWAEENGVVKFPENVKVNLVTVKYSNENFRSGSADIGMVSVPTFLVAWDEHREYRIVYPYGELYEGIYTYEGSNINSLQDLKEKKIAMPGPGLFTTTMCMLDILEKYGITENDFTPRYEHMPVIPKLIKEKEVHAGIVAQLVFPKAREYNLIEITTINDEFKKFYDSPIIVNVIVAKKNIDKETVKNVIDTIRKAYEKTQKYQKDVIESYNEKYRVDASKSFEFLKTMNFKPVDLWNKKKESVLEVEFKIAQKFIKEIKNIPELKDVIWKLD